MKKTIRALSLILVLALLCALVPVYAAGEETHTVTFIDTASGENITREVVDGESIGFEDFPIYDIHPASNKFNAGWKIVTGSDTGKDFGYNTQVTEDITVMAKLMAYDEVYAIGFRSGDDGSRYWPVYVEKGTALGEYKLPPLPAGKCYWTDNDNNVVNADYVPSGPFFASAQDHTPETVRENEVAATCTEDGSYVEVTYCTVCGEVLSRETVTVDATGHTPGTPVIENEVPPTETENGSFDRVTYCTVCGEELSREPVIVDATGHTPGKIVIENKVDPTCTEDGSYDEVVYCTEDGEEISRETVIVPATGVHTPGETVIENEVDPTCTEDGSHDEVVYCTVCGEELSRETVIIEATGHSYILVGQKSPTLLTPGYTGDWVCEDCGDVLVEGDYIPPIGTISVSSDPVKPTTPMGFTDVSTGDWFYDDVAYVYDNGLMNGTSSTKFSPYSTLTRAMVVTILYRMEGEPANRFIGRFADVPNYEWYTSAVEWAAKNEIVTGYTATKFGPDDPVTREQLAAILYRYAQYKGYRVTGSDSLGNCIDSADVSSYAVPAVQWAVEGDILLVNNGKLRPTESANRAEVAAAIASFYSTYLD